MARVLLALFVVLAVGCPPASARSAEPVHHDVELRLRPESGRLDGVTRITVSGRDAIALTLAPELTVHRFSIDGRPATADRNGGTWRIALDDGARHELVIEYGGFPAFGEGAERSEPFGRPFLSTEGAFLPPGTGWMPATVDVPVTFRLAVEVPEPYRAVATGRLVDEAAQGRVYRAEFVADRPMEPPSVFVGPYVVVEREQGGIRLRTYFYDEEAHLADTYLDQAATYLDLFQEKIGPYPYDAFHIVAAPLPVGLGFPGLTYVARRILHLPFMQTGSLAHELLHNWWGNAVRVDYRRGNWAEGLTTFMADYGLVEAESAEEARAMRLAWLRDFAALPPERDVPLTDFVARGHDAAQVIGYNKAAFVFHMLRDQIGPAAFDAGIRLFWDRHRFETASWRDLRASFEAASARDLSAFFDQWLNRSGAPRLHLDAVDARPADGGYEVTVTLSQDSPPYLLSVPVTVETEAGTKRERIELRGPETTATLRVGAAPLSISVDPDYDLFRHLAPGEAPPILRDVTLSPEAVTIVAVGDDEAAVGIARDLAERLMDTDVRPASVEDPEVRTSPLLVIGFTTEIESVLARTGAGATPESLAGRGTARSWVARRPDGPPVLVVEAEDAEALRALLRPLPHYRRSSFLVFEGGEVTAEGVWPAGDSPLSRRLDRAAAD